MLYLPGRVVEKLDCRAAHDVSAHPGTDEKVDGCVDNCVDHCDKICPVR